MSFAFFLQETLTPELEIEIYSQPAGQQQHSGAIWETQNELAYSMDSSSWEDNYPNHCGETADSRPFQQIKNQAESQIVCFLCLHPKVFSSDTPRLTLNADTFCDLLQFNAMFVVLGNMPIVIVPEEAAHDDVQWPMDSFAPGYSQFVVSPSRVMTSTDESTAPYSVTNLAATQHPHLRNAAPSTQNDFPTGVNFFAVTIR